MRSPKRAKVRINGRKVSKEYIKRIAKKDFETDEGLFYRHPTEAPLNHGTKKKPSIKKEYRDFSFLDPQTSLKHRFSPSSIRARKPSVSLKLFAFDTKDGVDPKTLFDIVHAFEEMMSAGLKDVGMDADVQVRIHSINEGCMDVHLFIIITSTIPNSSDLLQTVFAGIAAVFAVLDFSLKKRSSNQSDDEAFSAPERAGGMLSQQFSYPFLKSIQVFFRIASGELKDDVTIQTSLTYGDGSKERAADETQLTARKESIKELEDYLDNNSDQ